MSRGSLQAQRIGAHVALYGLFRMGAMNDPHGMTLLLRWSVAERRRAAFLRQTGAWERWLRTGQPPT